MRSFLTRKGNLRYSVKGLSFVIVVSQWRCSNQPTYITLLLNVTDPSDATSYRPISNLYVLSKLLERLIAQTIDYLVENRLLPELQSAYRVNHWMEMVLPKVLANILQAIDSSDMVVLTLLDLSAAFDTVDHSILWRRLLTSTELFKLCHTSVHVQ